MQINVEYEPNKKQAKFHACPADEAVYGGAKGGGKSCAIVMEAAAYGLEHKGATVYLFRETYDDLEANLISEWKTKIPSELYIYSETKHLATLKNGSQIFFRYIASDADAEGYQGRSMDFIGVDELTKHSERAIQTLLSCLRSPKGFPPLFRGTCNPGGKGHTWVKRRYVDATNRGAKMYTDEISGNTIAFIPALVYDNNVLMDNDPAYVRRLENLPEAQKKAFLYGDWDIFEGQYFSEFRYEIHTCEPFPIPDHWRIYRTLDYGLDMLACLWVAVSPLDEVCVFRELHEPDLTISDAARKINALTFEEIERTLAPPDLWNRSQETGKSREILFDEAGLRLTKSNNDREAGWLAIKELLKLNADGVPRLKIFRNCARLIEHLPQLQFSDKKPSDCSNEPHEITHGPDALRYWAISWTYPADEPKPKKGKGSWIDKFYSQDDEEEKGAYDIW